MSALQGLLNNECLTKWHELLCCWWLIWPIRNAEKKCIPTRQGLDGFQNVLRPVLWKKVCLSIGRVKWTYYCEVLRAGGGKGGGGGGGHQVYH